MLNQITCIAYENVIYSLLKIDTSLKRKKIKNKHIISTLIYYLNYLLDDKEPEDFILEQNVDLSNIQKTSSEFKMTFTTIAINVMFRFIKINIYDGPIWKFSTDMLQNLKYKQKKDIMIPMDELKERMDNYVYNLVYNLLQTNEEYTLPTICSTTPDILQESKSKIQMLNLINKSKAKRKTKQVFQDLIENPDFYFNNLKFESVLKQNEQTMRMIVCSLTNICLQLDPTNALNRMENEFLDSQLSINSSLKRYIFYVLINSLSSKISKSKSAEKDSLFYLAFGGYINVFFDQIRNYTNTPHNSYQLPTDNITYNVILPFHKFNLARYNHNLYYFDTNSKLSLSMYITKLNTGDSVYCLLANINKVNRIVDVIKTDTLIYNKSWKERLDIVKQAGNEDVIEVYKVNLDTIDQFPTNYRYIFTSGVGYGTKFRLQKSKKRTKDEASVNFEEDL